MRFYNRQHRHYCGIDLHVKTMYVCILDGTGQVLVHHNVPSTPEALLEIARAISRRPGHRRRVHVHLVLARRCCAAEGIAFVLGHAFAIKAIHGGKAKMTTRLVQDCEPAARRPVPAGLRHPAAMRATRDLFAVGCIWYGSAGSYLAHIQNTRAQYNLPGLRAAARLSGQSRGRPRTLADPSVGRASTST